MHLRIAYLEITYLRIPVVPTYLMYAFAILPVPLDSIYTYTNTNTNTNTYCGSFNINNLQRIAVWTGEGQEGSEAPRKAPHSSSSSSSSRKSSSSDFPVKKKSRVSRGKSYPNANPDTDSDPNPDTATPISHEPVSEPPLQLNLPACVVCHPMRIGRTDHRLLSPEKKIIVPGSDCLAALSQVDTEMIRERGKNEESGEREMQVFHFSILPLLALY